MFYRRKIILALLQLFEGELEKIQLQKLLFLFSKSQSKSVYDFIPYRFGSYSYSANADMMAMVRKGILNETKKSFKKNTPIDYLAQLKEEDYPLMNEVKKNYGRMDTTTLIRYTYMDYPFYAINSEIAEDILDKDHLQKIETAKPQSDDFGLFTIGYEGISLEKYLVRLLKNNVKLLVDVRKNPLSMKFGFSKTLLKRYSNSLGIDYLHVPEFGIESNKRQKLKTQENYDDLFEDYRKTTLRETEKEQEYILSLLKKYKRIALTCFEAEPCQCHRTHLADSICKLPRFDYKLIHL